MDMQIIKDLLISMNYDNEIIAYNMLNNMIKKLSKEELLDIDTLIRNPINMEYPYKITYYKHIWYYHSFIGRKVIQKINNRLQKLKSKHKIKNNK